MGKYLDEKSLINVNESSIFYKIKTFFIRLFRGKRVVQNESVNNNEIESISKQKDIFIEYIRNIESDETRLLRLQEQFDNGEIDRSSLTEEQVANLTALYKKQINDLKKSNESRIKRILQHKDGELFLNTENSGTKLFIQETNQ